MKIICEDQVILNQWHPITSLDVLTVGTVDNTILLDAKISFQLLSSKEASAWLTFDEKKTLLPIRICYGFIWVSLGNPPEDLFPFPEYNEPDRRNVATGVFGVIRADDDLARVRVLGEHQLVAREQPLIDGEAGDREHAAGRV